jgi:hypothetical protein
VHAAFKRVGSVIQWPAHGRCGIRAIEHSRLNSLQLPFTQASVYRFSISLSPAPLSPVRVQWCAKQALAARQASCLCKPTANQRAVVAGGLFGFCFGVPPPGQGRRGVLKKTSLFTHNCILPFWSMNASLISCQSEMLRSDADECGSPSSCPVSSSWRYLITP